MIGNGVASAAAPAAENSSNVTSASMLSVVPQSVVAPNAIGVVQEEYWGNDYPKCLSRLAQVRSISGVHIITACANEANWIDRLAGHSEKYYLRWQLT